MKDRETERKKNRNPKISEKFKKDRKTLTIVRKTDRQKESKPERQKKRY